MSICNLMFSASLLAQLAQQDFDFISEYLLAAGGLPELVTFRNVRREVTVKYAFAKGGSGYVNRSAVPHLRIAVGLPPQAAVCRSG